MIRGIRPANRASQRAHQTRGAVLGLLIAVLLVVVGLILVKVLGDAGRLQDCVMSGRTNCAPVDSTPAQ
jgi:hypothetical protein